MDKVINFFAGIIWYCLKSFAILAVVGIFMVSFAVLAAEHGVVGAIAMIVMILLVGYAIRGYW